jgi:hypothetical protein
MSSKEVAASENADPPEAETQSSTERLPDSSSADRGEPEPEDLSLDVVFEVLKNQRRRYVLRHLKEREEIVSLGALAEHVAAQENDKSVDTITSDERKRVYVGLYQCHLPKMDDMGIVEFNRDRGRVALTDTATELDEYLNVGTEEEGRDWYRYYGALSGIGIVATAGVGVGIAPIAPAVVLGAVVLAFSACTAVHAADRTSSEDSE